MEKKELLNLTISTLSEMSKNNKYKTISADISTCIEKLQRINFMLPILDGENSTKTADAGCDLESPSSWFQFKSVTEGYAITKYIGFDAETIVLPQRHLGKPVVAIAKDAFSGCLGIKTLKVPATVKRIGDNAFKSCSNLTTVILSDGLTSIGACAFDECVKLRNINFPDSITTIGHSSFSRTKLTSFKCPRNLRVLESGIFAVCRDLREVTLNENLKSIESVAFEYCDKLTTIRIPKSVQHIGRECFSGCKSLIHVYVENPSTEMGYAVFDDVLGEAPPALIIHCKAASTAQKYARENKIRCVSLS